MDSAWPDFVHLFDPDAELAIVQRRLPHWSQAGAICFVTWRTHDALPKAVLDSWFNDRRRWLSARGIDPLAPDWRALLHKLDRSSVRQFHEMFWNRWHDALDECCGQCVLRRPELAKIVGNSLHHFDGQSYLLLDFVVMPNHVHILVSFPDEDAMLTQCESWKHFTATQINRRLQCKGRFWQQDGFDHLVRSEAQLEYLRRYIAGNPAKAKLAVGEFLHYSRPE